MSDISKRVARLRQSFDQAGCDGFIIPRADEFLGEYVPSCAERLAYMTGFTGSAGLAIVTKEKAAFFTDGRYTIQAIAEVPSPFTSYSTSDDQAPLRTLSLREWLKENVVAGQKIALDPWLHTAAEVEAYEAVIKANGATLVFAPYNLVDKIWDDRPLPPKAKTVIHDITFAGEDATSKRQRIAHMIAEQKADALMITMPEDVMWLLNIRGDDVPKTPLTLCYAVLKKDGTVDLYVDADKIDAAVRAHLGAAVTLYPLEDFAKKLAGDFQGQTVMTDPMLSPAAVEALLKKGGANVIRQAQPIQLQKAMKNKAELDGSRQAHIRDGVAMVRFLARLNEAGFAAQNTEISASDLLEELRAEGALFRGLSFDTISGAGAHGAIVHYRADAQSDVPLLSGPVYLLDSGAQYQDGTTDVTRTIAVDTPSAEMKDRFTRVLKGHIQVALSLFDYGTMGDAIDAKARAALKEVGLDYAHGTGHGVGSYLSVHEGPTGLSPRANKMPLEKGMILSNEPGFYKNGEYGIRIENLLIVVEKAGGKLGFENLTMVPIDLHLVEASLLTDEELTYLNRYHAEVREKLMPALLKLDQKAARFLEEATRPLSKAPTNGLKKHEAPKI